MEQRLNSPSRAPDQAKGFSLIELLVVTAIAGILLALAISSFNGVVANATLNRSGQLMSDQIILARQEAIAKNRDVEVRFFTLDPTNGPKAIQSWIATEDGASQTPLGKPIILPDTVRLNTSHSPLISAEETIIGTVNFPPHGQKSYTGFRFRPDGSVALGLDSSNNYLTLQLVSERSESPANYYAVQLNPFTGKATTYRP